MANSGTSDDPENSSEEVETPKNSSGGGTGTTHEQISEYEKQRLKRIEENRARMEALGLKTMAKSFMGSVQNNVKKKTEKKGKRETDDDDDDDDDYKPIESDELEGLSSSAEEDDKDNDDEEEFTKSRKTKGKKKTKMPKKPAVKKRVPKKKSVGDLDYVDDDDALVKAIWLSLQDSPGFLDVKTQASQSSAAAQDGKSAENRSSNAKKGDTQIQEDTGKKKRKKMITSRVQMTEDEIIMHFFQFDEAGKGNITLRDLKRLAAVHDFMWSDKEMADMINCFDSDADGKLNLDDFRKIVGRCNMILAPEIGMTGKIL